MRRAFVIPSIDEKYRDLFKKSDITSDLFGKDLFKRLKYTKSLNKIVEELTPHQQKPLKMQNHGNRKSLPRKSRARNRLKNQNSFKGLSSIRIARKTFLGTTRMKSSHYRQTKDEQRGWTTKIFSREMEVNHQG